LEPIRVEDAVVGTYYLETDGDLAKVAEHMAAKRAIAADAVNNMLAILGAPRGT